MLLNSYFLINDPNQESLLGWKIWRVLRLRKATEHKRDQNLIFWGFKALIFNFILRLYFLCTCWCCYFIHRLLLNLGLEASSLQLDDRWEIALKRVNAAISVAVDCTDCVYNQEFHSCTQSKKTVTPIRQNICQYFPLSFVGPERAPRKPMELDSYFIVLK